MPSEQKRLTRVTLTRIISSLDLNLTSGNEIYEKVSFGGGRWLAGHFIRSSSRLSGNISVG